MPVLRTGTGAHVDLLSRIIRDARVRAHAALTVSATQSTSGTTAAGLRSRSSSIRKLLCSSRTFFIPQLSIRETHYARRASVARVAAACTSQTSVLAHQGYRAYPIASSQYVCMILAATTMQASSPLVRAVERRATLAGRGGATQI